MHVSDEIQASSAFVAAWLPGSEGAGVADVLLRDAQGAVQFDFVGKLSFDWPDTDLNPDDRNSPVASALFPTGFGLEVAASVGKID